MIKKCIILSSLILSGFSILFGQSQEEIISYNIFAKNENHFSRAKDFYKNFEIDSAITTLQKIKCINDGCRFKNYFLSKYYSKLDSSKSYDYLKLSVSQGQRLIYIVDEFPYEINFTELKRIENDYLNSLNFDVIKALSEACSRDRLIRKNWNKLHHTKAYKMELLRIDSLNQKLLDSIYCNYGWPGYSLIGSVYGLSDLGLSPDPILLLLHSDEEYIKKYIKPVREACESDEES